MIESSYAVDTDPVFVTIEIGDGQIGGGQVIVGGKILGQCPVRDLKVGAAAEIRGKRLVVKTLVSDESETTNRTSVRYVLSGGKVKQPFVSIGTVDKNGDAIAHLAEFSFV